MKPIPLLFLFIMTVYSSISSAQDYYWRFFDSSITTATFLSPSDAVVTVNGLLPSTYFVLDSVSGSTAIAKRFYTSNGLPYYITAYEIRRYGDGCPLGSEYNASTGECLAPEEPENLCSDKADAVERFSRSGTAPDGFMSITSSGNGVAQRQGCKGGCATEIIDNRCKVRESGAYFCNGSVIYSGQQCSTTGTGDQIAEDTGASSEPEVITEDKPCVYSASGDKQVCTSTKSEEKEGQSCGSVNGVETCISKAPTKNGIDISTEVTKTTAEDGSTQTTKTDTATVTKCTGVNICTTKTATTTTTTKTDGTGKVTSVNGVCKGDACPDKNGDPDGNGDGLGDCATGDCGEGEGGQDWYEPAEDTFASVLEQFSTDVLLTPVASQTTSFLTFSASGSCPRWNINAWVFDIRLDQMCTGDIPWAAIKAIILAAAAFFSFRIALL